MTQKTNLFLKIKDDLKKCLDTSKTVITYNKISEAIYCHTSSFLTSFQDSKIKVLCEDIGIDKFVEDIWYVIRIF